MQRQSNTADVIVAGLGAMGAAATWQLAARGISVIGIDRHHPPHPYGSSHGETRITRLAIGEGPEYVPFVLRSHELWPEIEGETNSRLFTQTGGLVIGPSPGPSDSFLEQTRQTARQYGITYEDLSAGELRDRFPLFQTDQSVEAYFEPQSGYLRPERAIEAQLELAQRHGAELRFHERLQRWDRDGDGLQLETDKDTYLTSRLILCVGPWIHELFPEGRQLFAIYQQLIYWFPIVSGYEHLRDMPIFIFDLSGERSGFVHLDGFYGFPAIDGPSGGLKIGTEQFHETTEPDDQQHPATQTEIDEMYERCIQPHLRHLGPTPIRTLSCLYTSTEGNRFVIDRHPADDDVLIVAACSGHGFKHSAAIGEAVAQLVGEGQSEISLAPFGLSPARGKRD